jgi:hypothetical protein
LQAFAAERGLQIAAWYVENESGAKLARPELFRLIADSQAGDVLRLRSEGRAPGCNLSLRYEGAIRMPGSSTQASRANQS